MGAETTIRGFLTTIDTGQVVLPKRVTVGDHLAGWLDAVEPSLAATTVRTVHRILS